MTLSSWPIPVDGWSCGTAIMSTPMHAHCSKMYSRLVQAHAVCPGPMHPCILINILGYPALSTQQVFVDSRLVLERWLPDDLCNHRSTFLTCTVYWWIDLSLVWYKHFVGFSHGSFWTCDDFFIHELKYDFVSCMAGSTLCAVCWWILANDNWASLLWNHCVAWAWKVGTGPCARGLLLRPSHGIDSYAILRTAAHHFEKRLDCWRSVSSISTRHGTIYGLHSLQHFFVGGLHSDTSGSRYPAVNEFPQLIITVLVLSWVHEVHVVVRLCIPKFMADLSHFPCSCIFLERVILQNSSVDAVMCTF